MRRKNSGTRKSGWGLGEDADNSDAEEDDQIDKLVARGGMAAVYLAHHVKLNRPVALKILSPPPDADDSGAFEERFRLEAETLAALDHPNIVILHDFGDLDDGRFFLAMEYIDGPRLSDVLRDCIRQVDTLARYGGDEFTILLLDTEHDKARLIAERIRRTVAETVFEGGRGTPIQLTISIGIASYPLHARERDPLLDLADKAMYRAKSRGRNCVSSASDLT